MLKDNIKAMRQSKGLSQEELALKLHAVRQTVSKWERGLSVPDSDMLIAMSEVFETPVSTLLGESLPEQNPDSLKVISEKLEIINQQLAEKSRARKKLAQWLLISLCVVIVAITAILFLLDSPYSSWDYTDPEIAILGTVAHSLEWLFVRVAPVALIISIVGIILIRKSLAR